MSELHLSRVGLAPTVTARSLASVLVPEDLDRRTAVAHRLLWPLFGDTPERTRDFLWREESGGGPLARLRFVLLSRRPPAAADAALLQVETKPFAPALASGQRLGFLLRANPVVTRWNDATGKPRRDDVVMSLLHGIEPGAARREARQAAVVEAGTAWLRAQGERHGFALTDELRVDAYLPRLIPRERGDRPIRFTSLDFAGVLTVTEPQAFLATLAGGFGKAKAWGCGLMLIRRA